MSKQLVRKPIPRLPGLPFLGNLHAFRYKRLALLRQVAQECGDVGIFRVGPWPVVLLNTSEYAHQVLVEHADHFEKSPLLRRYLRPLLGNGLLTIDQAAHKPRRKLIAPAFQHQRVSAYATDMISFTEYIQREWNHGAEIDFTHEMTRLTLWIVGKTLFNVDVRIEAEELRSTINTIGKITDGLTSTLVHLPYTWPTPRNNRFRRAISKLHFALEQMIAQRRQEAADHGDVLSLLLRTQDADNGNMLTDQEIRDEVLTLFTAGHATTATALTWACYLLSQHAEVYAKLQTEVDQVLGDRSPTLADVANLPYALQVFKEVLRLYPPAYAILRQTMIPLELDGYYLPRGMRVAISPYTLHRRPDYFPDPDQFDPNRWTPHAERELPRYAYLPFSAGSRVCIGNHFALMEGQLILATLAQHVTFSRPQTQPVDPESLAELNPPGMKMVVQRRK